MKRLYAVGEVACTGVHGANRLASTSLLEVLVWGCRAGKDETLNREGDDYSPDIEFWIAGTEKIDSALLAQDGLTIKNTMGNYVGLIRARNILRNLQNEIEIFYQNAKLTPDMIGLRNGIQTANAIIAATMEERLSLGAHYLLEATE